MVLQILATFNIYRLSTAASIVVTARSIPVTSTNYAVTINVCITNWRPLESSVRYISSLVIPYKWLWTSLIGLLDLLCFPTTRIAIKRDSSSVACDQ